MTNIDILWNTYNEVMIRLNKLDFPSLWSGFKMYSFAIYDDLNICINNQMIPYDQRFIGNTAIDYENKFVAIWNIRMAPVSNMDLLASQLVHEMFHCFQKENKETRYPNDLKLLQYPHSQANYSLKYQENQVLIQAYQESDFAKKQDLFRQFLQIRATRKEMIDHAILHEFQVETIEGLAEFVGLKALRFLSKESFERRVESMMDNLKQKVKIMDIRRISYDVGSIFFLLLEQLHIEFDVHQLSENRTIFELLFEEDSAKPISLFEVDSDFKQLVQKELSRRQSIIEDSLSTEQIDAAGFVIAGYDPMNMFRFEDYIYCSHFVFLKRDEEMKMIHQPVVLVMKENSPNELSSYNIGEKRRNV